MKNAQFGKLDKAGEFIPLYDRTANPVKALACVPITLDKEIIGWNEYAVKYTRDDGSTAFASTPYFISAFCITKTKDVLVFIEREQMRQRSAWRRGVYELAYMMIENLDMPFLHMEYSRLWRQLLNGADSWLDYSHAGLALINDTDIAKMLSTPSKLKRTHNGEKQPNRRETWLDIQARALRQAFAAVYQAVHDRGANVIETLDPQELQR